MLFQKSTRICENNEALNTIFDEIEWMYFLNLKHGGKARVVRND